MSLVEFLLARIQEDEDMARAATGLRWRTSTHEYVDIEDADHPETIGIVYSSSDGGVADWPTAEHIAHHDPARVLAECAAKRRMLMLLDEYSETSPHVPRLTIYTHDVIPKILALPYADHPDYLEEWRA